MISTDTASAIAELHAALDPVKLGTRIMTETGQKAIAYDTEVISGMHRGKWKNVSGELESSFRYDVEASETTITLTEIASAEHAKALHNREGYSVLVAFDSGRIIDMLKAAFTAVPDRTL